MSAIATPAPISTVARFADGRSAATITIPIHTHATAWLAWPLGYADPAPLTLFHWQGREGDPMLVTVQVRMRDTILP